MIFAESDVPPVLLLGLFVALAVNGMVKAFKAFDKEGKIQTVAQEGVMSKIRKWMS